MDQQSLSSVEHGLRNPGFTFFKVRDGMIHSAQRIIGVIRAWNAWRETTGFLSIAQRHPTRRVKGQWTNIR